MKDFKLAFTLADSEYLTAVRLVVGAICADADKDIDSAEDLKVCVTESCLILKNCGYERVEITFTVKETVEVSVCGFGGEHRSADNEFSLALISALVSSCDIARDGEAIGRVNLKL